MSSLFDVFVIEDIKIKEENGMCYYTFFCVAHKLRRQCYKKKITSLSLDRVGEQY